MKQGEYLFHIHLSQPVAFNNKFQADLLIYCSAWVWRAIKIIFPIFSVSLCSRRFCFQSSWHTIRSKYDETLSRNWEHGDTSYLVEYICLSFRSILTYSSPIKYFRGRRNIHLTNQDWENYRASHRMKNIRYIDEDKYIYACCQC